MQGVGATGKTVTLRWLFAHHFISHAFVDCIECYQPKLLFQSILSQLADGSQEDDIRCDNVSDFTRMLTECLGDRRAVIVLENGDRLRDEMSLMSVFTRLQEITRCNVSTILETRLDWSKLRPAEDILTPVRIHFSQYSRDELIRLVAAFLESEVSLDGDRDSQFRLQYTGLVLSLFYSITRYRFCLMKVPMAFHCEQCQEANDL